MTEAAPIPSSDDALTISEDGAISDVLRIMDDTGLDIVFVVDEEARQVGYLTLDEVSRHFENGGNALDPTSDAMNRNTGALGADFIRPALQTIPVSSPDLRGNELSYLTQCIEDNWISSTGPFVERFERAFADYVGAECALATSSGTAALHLVLVALGIGPGDEVIVPDLTFAATANAVIHAGATPVLVDVLTDTRTIDVEATQQAISAKTRAIIPVHLFGQPADMSEIGYLARKAGLLVIEDGAEALGSTYDNRQVGGFGDAAIFSFFPNKLITTGEGGMAIFRDDETLERARILRDHGMRPGKRYWHDAVGFNYRMTNLQAAVGCAQLERVEEFVERKLEVGAAYRRALADRPGLTLPAVRDNVRDTYWLFTIAIDSEKLNISRDDMIAKLHRMGIETRRMFYPLHDMPPYTSFCGGRSFDVSDRLSRTALSLPTAVTLSEEDIDHITEAIGRILDLRALTKEYGR